MPRPDRSAERIPQILNAAAKVFAEQGVQGAKMDSVAQEAGLSKAGVYLYFKSKDALILALLDHFFEANLAALKLIPQGDSAAGRICTWIDALGLAMTEGAHLQTIGFEFLALAGRDEKARAVVLSFYDHYIEALSRVIQTDGFDDAAAKEKATEIVAFLEGVNLIWMAKSGNIDFTSLAKSGVRSLLG